MPENGILIVDGVFAYRPEFNDYWDFRVWVDIDAELSVARGVQRDAEMSGDGEQAEKLHRNRYLVGERLYIAEVDPCSFVDVIIDNTDFERPHLTTFDGE
jgi:uridine kinase